MRISDQQDTPMTNANNAQAIFDPSEPTYKGRFRRLLLIPGATGTPILSIRDGVVTRMGNHRFAGKYIEIDHPGQFKTRYLHLSRIDVKRGQRVSHWAPVSISSATSSAEPPCSEMPIPEISPVHDLAAHLGRLAHSFARRCTGVDR